MIQKILSDFLGKPLDYKINPDEAVAMGAAIYANNLPENASVDACVPPAIKDVIPKSLGIELTDGTLSRIIMKNT